MTLSVLLFGFFYCLPLLVSLVVGWIMVISFWRECGELSVANVIGVVVWFVTSWVPVLNFMSALYLLYQSDQKFKWASRTVIKSRDRQHEETARALRGDR